MPWWQETHLTWIYCFMQQKHRPTSPYKFQQLSFEGSHFAVCIDATAVRVVGSIMKHPLSLFYIILSLNWFASLQQSLWRHTFDVNSPLHSASLNNSSESLRSLLEHSVWIWLPSFGWTSALCGTTDKPCPSAAVYPGLAILCYTREEHSFDCHSDKRFFSSPQRPDRL
jgi:hypothetical protein